jgi:hypothetical protein
VDVIHTNTSALCHYCEYSDYCDPQVKIRSKILLKVGSILLFWNTLFILVMITKSVVLRMIFGPKMDEVTAGWRKLRNEQLRDLHSLPSIIRIIKSRGDEMCGPCSMNGGEEERLWVIGGKERGKKTTRKTKT